MFNDALSTDELHNVELVVAGKVKVKLSLGLTKHDIMKTYLGSGGTAPHIL
jgi:hypothetical protein